MNTTKMLGEWVHAVRPWLSAVAALALALVVLLTCLPVHAGKAHEHGVGRLNLVQDGAHWSLELELPLDTLVGFERPPRTPAERQAAQAALARLRDAPALARLEVPAPHVCVAASVAVQAPVLEGQAQTSDGHGDARLSVELRCPDSVAPTRLHLPMFTAFPRLKRLEVQAVLKPGQRRFRVTPANPVIELGR